MIVIDPASPTPPFEQLRAQYVAAIASGELPPGSRLPTVRRLAGDLGLALALIPEVNDPLSPGTVKP